MSETSSDKNTERDAATEETPFGFGLFDAGPKREEVPQVSEDTSNAAGAAAAVKDTDARGRGARRKRGAGAPARSTSRMRRARAPRGDAAPDEPVAGDEAPAAPPSTAGLAAELDRSLPPVTEPADDGPPAGRSEASFERHAPPAIQTDRPIGVWSSDAGEDEFTSAPAYADESEAPAPQREARAERFVDDQIGPPLESDGGPGGEPGDAGPGGRDRTDRQERGGRSRRRRGRGRGGRDRDRDRGDRRPMDIPVFERPGDRRPQPPRAGHGGFSGGGSPGGRAEPPRGDAVRGPHARAPQRDGGVRRDEDPRQSYFDWGNEGDEPPAPGGEATSTADSPREPSTWDRPARPDRSRQEPREPARRDDLRRAEPRRNEQGRDFRRRPDRQERIPDRGRQLRGVPPADAETFGPEPAPPPVHEPEFVDDAIGPPLDRSAPEPREPWGDRPRRDRDRSRHRHPGSEGRSSDLRQPPRGAGRNDDWPTAAGTAPEVEDETAGEEADVDVPSWVEAGEDETDRRGRRFPLRGRRGGGAELLPAGEGIDPADEDAEPLPPAAVPTRPERIANKRILINAIDPEEVRIAIVENGQLEELYYERPTEKKYLGNIYKGRVVNLEPGIQAAFVDLGIGRNGFLHVSDVLPAYKDAASIPMENLSTRLPDRRRLRIQDILRKGQEVLVQISKDAIGAKGPSLTTYVSVPGKYLVLMPGVSRHGVSKRIQDDDERSDLRSKLSQLNPPKGVGYIVRTAGQHRPQADLEKDFQYLMKIWEEIHHGVQAAPVASLVYAESNLVTRTMRDLSGSDVTEILIDNAAVYEEARKFLDEVMPQAARKLKHYSGTVPLFSRFGVEDEIEKIYNRRVPLPSGGHIVLEQTEALVAIDVNSGKYRDEEDLEATALKTNLEAAQEIARQLRLRDLGGVIVNDFIDMETESNRRAVERALRSALKRDRAKSWISRISRFGIIEMTRQRVRPSFERSNHEPCKVCRGTGGVKSPRSCGIAILRQIRAALGSRRRDLCQVTAHPQVADYLLNERRQHLIDLESEYQKKIVIRGDASLAPDEHTIQYH